MDWRALFAVVSCYAVLVDGYGYPVPSVPTTPSKFHSDGDREDAFTHRFVHVNRTLKYNQETNVTFHYVEIGDKSRDAIAFFHGIPDSWYLWHRQMLNLSNEYFVTGWDIKGMGQSSKPYSNKIWPELNELGGDYSPEVSTDEIMTALHQIGVDRVTIVTLDMSSWIFATTAGNWSDRIRSYIKCQSTVAVHDERHVPQFKRFQYFPKLTLDYLDARRDLLVLSLLDNPEGALTNSRVVQQLDNTTLERVLHDFSYPGCLRGWVSYINSLPLGRQQMLNQVEAYKTYNFPTFILQGAGDPAQPPYYFDGTYELFISWGIWPYVSSFPWGYYSEVIPVEPDLQADKHCTKYFPMAVYESIPDAGHFFPHEKPEHVSTSIRQFLKGEWQAIIERGNSASTQKWKPEDMCVLLWGKENTLHAGCARYLKSSPSESTEQKVHAQQAEL